METIEVDVNFYDEEQQRLFGGFPNAEALRNLTERKVLIEKDELLAYMMFTEQDDDEGFRNYDDLRRRIGSRLGDIEDYLSFNGGSVQSKVKTSGMMSAGFTERLGVALGLTVLNKLHGLTQADWTKIPETRGRWAYPTFDFEIPVASTGTGFIQAENKGSVLDAATEKSQSISNHYTNILNKKAYVRKAEALKNIPLHENLFYGTIGVISQSETSIASVWLVDPPAFLIDMPADKYKLLARLYYYLEVFRKIGLKKRLIKALEKRVKQIEKSNDYLIYDHVPLDERFKDNAASTYYMDDKDIAFVDTNEAFGRILLIDSIQEGSIFYLIALTRVIMRLVVKQDFKAITHYYYEPDFMNENVAILIRANERLATEWKGFGRLNFVLSEKNKASYYEASYYGKVSHDHTGRIFGELN